MRCAHAVVLALALLAPSTAGADHGPLLAEEVHGLPYDLGTFVDSGAACRDPEDCLKPVKGVVYIPPGLASPAPIVFIQHGNSAVEESERGFAYLAEPLAAKGTIVVSMFASQQVYSTPARSQLVLETIERFAAVDDGSLGLELGLAGRIDLDRIGLLGHSRGGEAVADAAREAREAPGGARWGIRAVFLIAPTGSGKGTMEEHLASEPSRPTGAPLLVAKSYAHLARVTFADDEVDPTELAFAMQLPLTAALDFHTPRTEGLGALGVLLPSCDGEVHMLDGAAIFDNSRYLAADTAAKYQFLSMGANHRYYNELWADDDAALGWGGTRQDPYCAPATSPEGLGSGRLSAEDQRAQAVAIVSAFFDHALLGEPSAQLRGEMPLVIPGRVHVSHHPSPSARLMIDDLATRDSLHSNDLGGSVRFEGLSVVRACYPETCPGPTVGNAHRLVLGWGGERGMVEVLLESDAGPTPVYALVVPKEHRDLSDFAALSFRAAVVPDDDRNPEGAAQDLHVVVVDKYGARARVRVSSVSDALFAPPGETAARVTLNTVRVPLAGFGGVDLRKIEEVRFEFDVTATGVVQVADVMLQR